MVLQQTNLNVSQTNHQNQIRQFRDFQMDFQWTFNRFTIPISKSIIFRESGQLSENKSVPD